VGCWQKWKAVTALAMRRNRSICAGGGRTRQIAGVLKKYVIYWNAMKYDKSGKGALSEL
jgi:hypothetical protein